NGAFTRIVKPPSVSIDDPDVDFACIGQVDLMPPAPGLVPPHSPKLERLSRVWEAFRLNRRAGLEFAGPKSRHASGRLSSQPTIPSLLNQRRPVSVTQGGGNGAETMPRGVEELQGFGQCAHRSATVYKRAVGSPSPVCPAIRPSDFMVARNVIIATVDASPARVHLRVGARSAELGGADVLVKPKRSAPVERGPHVDPRYRHRTDGVALS